MTKTEMSQRAFDQFKARATEVLGWAAFLALLGGLMDGSRGIAIGVVLGAALGATEEAP